MQSLEFTIEMIQKAIHNCFGRTMESYDYKNILTISNNTTPGIPKTPTISALRGLIAIDRLNIPPIKLKKNRITPPINPLINNLTNNFIGITKSIPTIYSNTSPSKNAPMVYRLTPIKNPSLFPYYNIGLTSEFIPFILSNYQI